MNNYINNKEFEKLVQHCQLERDDKEANEELCRVFYVLADNILKRYNFNFTQKDDVDGIRQDMVLQAFDKLELFDRQRGTAFNWFTTIMLNKIRMRRRRRSTEEKMFISLDQFEDSDFLFF